MNRFLSPSLVNRTTGPVRTPTPAATLETDSEHDYKAALMRVLQHNGTGLIPQNYETGGYGYDSGYLATSTSKSTNLPEDLTVMQAEEYTDGEGELDMLIGYFMMNFICIVFFLMFGMCVICSCMRKKPGFLKNKGVSGDKSQGQMKQTTTAKNMFSFRRAITPKMSSISAPPMAITNPRLKPTFKALVSRALASEELKKMGGPAQGPGSGSRKNSRVEEEEGPGTAIRKCSGAGLNSFEKGKLLRRSSECNNGRKKHDTRIEMENIEPMRCKSVTSQVQIHIEPTSRSRSTSPVMLASVDDNEDDFLLENPSNGTLPTSSNQSHAPVCPKCHPDGDASAASSTGHICDCNCQKSVQDPPGDADSVASADSDEQRSVVRQNLLGPLSFDDLYYT